MSFIFVGYPVYYFYYKVHEISNISSFLFYYYWLINVFILYGDSMKKSGLSGTKIPTAWHIFSNWLSNFWGWSTPRSLLATSLTTSSCDHHEKRIRIRSPFTNLSVYFSKSSQKWRASEFYTGRDAARHKIYSLVIFANLLKKNTDKWVNGLLIHFFMIWRSTSRSTNCDGNTGAVNSAEQHVT